MRESIIGENNREVIIESGIIEREGDTLRERY